jgi:hypothetical protein
VNARNARTALWNVLVDVVLPFASEAEEPD